MSPAEWGVAILVATGVIICMSVAWRAGLREGMRRQLFEEMVHKSK